jgi:hypothetical protein
VTVAVTELVLISVRSTVVALVTVSVHEVVAVAVTESVTVAVTVAVGFGVGEFCEVVVLVVVLSFVTKQLQALLILEGED